MLGIEGEVYTFQFLILGYNVVCLLMKSYPNLSIPHFRIPIRHMAVNTQHIHFQFLILGYARLTRVSPHVDILFQFLILGYRMSPASAAGVDVALSIPHFRILDVYLYLFNDLSFLYGGCFSVA